MKPLDYAVRHAVSHATDHVPDLAAHAAALFARGLDEGWVVFAAEVQHGAWCEVLRIYPNPHRPHHALLVVVTYTHGGARRVTDLMPAGDVAFARPRATVALSDRTASLFLREGCRLDRRFIAWPEALTRESWCPRDRPQYLPRQPASEPPFPSREAVGFHAATEESTEES